MKISVIGTGYVGLVTGVCFADLGNDVICMDIDKEKIEKLSKGIPVIYEPGLEDLLKRNLKEKRIKFTTSMKETVEDSEIIFIAVGTPPDENGEPDMRAIWNVAKQIAQYINGHKIIINKSTVPVGSAERVYKIIKENLTNNHEFDIISNPEFLREGSAVYDFMNPDRIVIGGSEERAIEKVKELYQPLDAPILITDVKSAELIKYASNAYLATRISFINEIANFCEATGADVELVAKGMGLDKRIGPHFLNAGIGFGGSCFPKDTLGLVTTAKKFGVECSIVKSTIEVNNQQRIKFFEKIYNYFNKELKDKTFGIWGLAFKPDTDDMRESPSIEIINLLLEKGAKVKVFDPAAIENAKKIWKEKIEYTSGMYEVCENSDALIILTEWNEFKQADLKRVHNLLKTPVIFDGRNIYELKKMKELSFKYFSIGRPPVL